MEYADFLIDSSKYKTDKLDRIQKTAVKILDKYQHKGRYEAMLLLYGLEDLGARRERHHLAIIYKHSKTIET